MKIVLVYPRFKYPLVSGAIEPLGVQYLASVLKKEDLEVDIIDLTFETNLQLLNRAVINADYAGFSFNHWIKSSSACRYSLALDSSTGI